MFTLEMSKGLVESNGLKLIGSLALKVSNMRTG